MLVSHWGLERDGQWTGSRVWTGVYALDGMSGSLQTVKIQYSDSVLTCTVQNLIRIHVCAVRVCVWQPVWDCLPSFSQQESMRKFALRHPLQDGNAGGRWSAASDFHRPAGCLVSEVTSLSGSGLRVWHITSTTWYVWHHEPQRGDEPWLHRWFQLSATDQLTQQKPKYCSFWPLVTGVEVINKRSKK